MKIEVTKLPKSEVKIIIELSAEETQKYLEESAKQVSQMVKIPGFRPGHVPLEVLQKHVSNEAIEDHMLDTAVPQSYGEAVLKEKVQVVSRPKVNILEKNPLKFEATVAIYPDVEITGYEKVSIKKNEVKVEEKDVEDLLKDIQKRRATFKEVDRAAQNGDKVEMDFEGYDEGGALLESTKSKNHPVMLGEGTLVPGFEESVVGMKKGEQKKFHVTFPKDYFHKPFQGKKVEFKVTLNKLEEAEIPELTPEFLKTIAGVETGMEEVKTNIRMNLQHEKEHAEKDRRENIFLEEIIKLTKVELPETLIDEELDGMIEEFKSELDSRGINIEKYLETTKKEIKDLKTERRKEAEKRLILRFGLQKIFDQEKLEVGTEEIKQEIEKLKTYYPENERSKLDREYKEGTYLVKRLENKLKIDKLFDKYLGK
jgi:trigger factor